MTQHEIEKSRLALHNAGTLEDRDRFQDRLITRLRDDVEVLEEGRRSLGADFRRQLERWRTERVPESTPVRAIPSDLADSRLYRITALFAMLAEMGLAAWVFWHLGVGWLFGVLTALFLTFTLHGVFLQLFNDPERPKETVHRLKSRAALPAIVGFLIALGSGMMARYVYGPLAVALLPLFSLSLWLGTLSLLVLAASLFTMSHILAWSRRYEKAYRKNDDDLRTSAAFLRELGGEQTETAAVRSTRLLPAGNEREVTRPDGQTVFPIIILMLGAWTLTACTTAATSKETALHNESFVRQAMPQVRLHVLIDWSGSCMRAPLEEAWQNVRAELPELLMTYGITNLMISAFDEDGWCPRTIVALELPRLLVASSKPNLTTEWESFANIRDALREQEQAKLAGEKAVAETAYRQKLHAALAALDAAEILPPPARQSRRSDVVGLLERIAKTRSTHREYVLVLTDLADTSHRELPSVAAPERDIFLAVLLVPAASPDVLATTGKALSSAEQFALRSREIQQAIAWAGSAPYFATNLANLFPKRPAVSK